MTQQNAGHSHLLFGFEYIAVIGQADQPGATF
jgi:hypothetical protein